MAEQELNPAASAAVRALTELPDEQQKVYRARYVTDESREETCERLGITGESYDKALAGAMRWLRTKACPGGAHA